MAQVCGNFEEGMIAITHQLEDLRSVLGQVDPLLLKHLINIGADNFEVAFQVTTSHYWLFPCGTPI